MYETESKYCPWIHSLLVSKIFTHFVGITWTVFSLPSANFEDAVKTRQIRQRANYSCRRTNQRLFNNTFVQILYFAPFMNTYTNGCLQYHVAAETLTKLVMKKFLQLFFEQVMGSFLKKIKYIKTAQMYLREWQKWQQLLIPYINIVTFWCYSWESRMYSNNYHVLNSVFNGYNCIHMYAHILIFCVMAKIYYININLA